MVGLFGKVGGGVSRYGVDRVDGDAGWKNGRSRRTESRRGSHASTSITCDSLTIGFPAASVTEIYGKSVHFVSFGLLSFVARNYADLRF